MFDAGEFMYHYDWPVHVANILGVSDHLDLMPPSARPERFARSARQ
jgi:hypothetical protein